MSADSTPNPGLAARAGRWSAQHRKKAIWGWLAFVVIAFAIGGAIGTETQTNAQSGVGESGRAARTVDNAFPKHQVEQVLVQSNSATASDPSFRSAVGDVQRRLSAVPYTKAFESPYKPANAGQISANGHSALLRFEIAGDETQAADRVAATLKTTAAAQAANPGFTVEQVGDASISKQLNDSIGKDFSRAFVTSLPITLVILLIAFGALVAASVPILLALTAVLATIGLVAVTSHFSPVDSSINEVILSTTRCSTSAANARSANRGAPKRQRWRLPRRPRGGQCSSRASRLWSPWQACTSGAHRRSRRSQPGRSSWSQWPLRAR
jgi:uncharacterized membrane protein YdfJ with MMPL/SSD domain